MNKVMANGTKWGYGKEKKLLLDYLFISHSNINILLAFSDLLVDLLSECNFK